MSFSGFVFDMISRDRQNRDLRNLRRERYNERRRRILGEAGKNPIKVTVEELDRIDKQTKAKERDEQKYMLRMALVILGICVCMVVILLICILW